MLKPWVVGVVLLVAAAPAAAQAPRQNEETQVRARQRISIMEALLERAVSNGADNMLRQVRAVMLDAPMLSGPPQVRGVRLEGYGVFFDVGVPLLRLPIMWSVRHMMTDTTAASVTLAELKETLRQMSPRERELMEPIVRRLELQIGVPSRTRIQAGAPGVTAASALQPGGREVAVPPPVAPAESSVLDDPMEAYTREVKAALVDAMIENGWQIEISPDEWFTVAARDNVPRDPLIPGDITDYTTVIFRIKGSDLAAFRQGRLTLEETRARVVTREY